MPLYKKILDKSNDKLYVWQVSENLSTLQLRFENVYGTHTALPDFRSEERLREWYAVRILTHEMLGEKREILYASQGCPYLDSGPWNISVSHCKKFVAVRLAIDHRIGVDLELMDERIRRISDKFINAKEHSKSDNSLSYLYKIWCAKEVLFKIYRKGGLDFKSDLHVEIQGDNVFARIEKQDEKLSFPLETVLINDLMVVYNQLQ